MRTESVPGGKIVSNKMRGKKTKHNNRNGKGKNCKGQIQITFNWIYILIAGAIILLFFIGIAAKQKVASEDRLTIEVVRVMESIFTGAGVSEKTKNFIDTSGLADYTLFFGCEEETSEFGIKESTARSQNSVNPIFSPAEISSSRLVVWGLPYRMPYKVMNFLMISSVNSKYFIVGSGNGFSREFINATNGFNVQQISSLEDADPEKNFQVRIIDVDGSYVHEGLAAPSKLQSLDSGRVSAVVFEESKVTYYQMDEIGRWSRLGDSQVVSLGGERDAAKYAAIFAANNDVYECNMQKAFRRLEYLNIVYGGKEIVRDEIGGKLKELVDYYTGNPELTYSTECLNFLQNYEENVASALASHQRNTGVCRLDQATCHSLALSGRVLQNTNNNLAQLGDCITLY